MRWLWLSALIIAIDQVTKYAMVRYGIYGGDLYDSAYLNMIVSYNAGAAFAFLDRPGEWPVYFFAAFSFLVSSVLILWLYRLSRRTAPYSTLCSIGLALIIGGAIGNLIDRVHLRYVIDFIDFHIHTWHFATFNMADAAISVGACVLLIHGIITYDRTPHSSREKILTKKH